MYPYKQYLQRQWRHVSWQVSLINSLVLGIYMLIVQIIALSNSPLLTGMQAFAAALGIAVMYTGAAWMLGFLPIRAVILLAHARSQEGKSNVKQAPSADLETKALPLHKDDAEAVTSLVRWIAIFIALLVDVILSTSDWLIDLLVDLGVDIAFAFV